LRRCPSYGSSSYDLNCVGERSHGNKTSSLVLLSLSLSFIQCGKNRSTGNVVSFDVCLISRRSSNLKLQRGNRYYWHRIKLSNVLRKIVENYPERKAARFIITELIANCILVSHFQQFPADENAWARYYCYCFIK